jgi:Flp pilus assembly protein TadG
VSVEAAVILPLLLLLFLATVQLGAMFYARAVASSAARQALDAARVTDGTETAGQSAGRQFLDQVSAGLQDPAVTVDRGTEDVAVIVAADVMSIVPGWQPHVTVTVTAPTERVVD